MRRSVFIILFAAALSLAAAAQPAGRKALVAEDRRIETEVEDGKAQVRLTLTAISEELQVGNFVTRILYREYEPGKIIEHVVAESRNVERVWDGKEILQTFELDPVLYWTPETPTVFVARTVVQYADGSKDGCETSFLFRGPAPESLSGVVLPAADSLDREHWDCLLTLLKRQGINAVAQTGSASFPVGELCDRIGLILCDKPAEGFQNVSDILDEDYFPVGREIKSGSIAKFGVTTAYRGDSLSLVQVQAMDRMGNLVPNPALTFSVAGPGSLENVGQASAFVRRSGPGPITVTVSTKTRGKVIITL